MKMIAIRWASYIIREDGQAYLSSLLEEAPDAARKWIPKSANVIPIRIEIPLPDVGMEAEGGAE